MKCMCFSVKIITSNICRLGTRQKTEARNTAGVGVNLAKTGRGHPFIGLVRYEC